MKIAFVMRQSPDWGVLAADYEAGGQIDPCRYKPQPDLPGFPPRIEESIAAWNQRFELNYFRCRQRLKEITLGLMAGMPDSELLAQSSLAAGAETLRNSRTLLFYMDDDDWFAPDIRERLQGLDLGDIDVAVFPLVRIGQPVYTFIRQAEPARIVIGERLNFRFRYQTNNYGVVLERMAPDSWAALKDHSDASRYADLHNLTDGYFDRIISATSKTPCSATALATVLKLQKHSAAIVRRYVDALRATAIPDGVSWLRAPLRQTVELFDAVVKSARPV